MEMPHSPLCSFSCSFRCFLKLKDFPQVGSEQVKVFWCTCWYFWWCCQGKKTKLSAPSSSSGTPHPGSPALQEVLVFPGTHIQVLAVGKDFATAFEVTQEDLTLCRLPGQENMGKVIGRKEEGWKSSGICPWFLPPHPPSLFPTHKT